MGCEHFTLEVFGFSRRRKREKKKPVWASLGFLLSMESCDVTVKAGKKNKIGCWATNLSVRGKTFSIGQRQSVYSFSLSVWEATQRELASLLLRKSRKLY